MSKLSRIKLVMGLLEGAVLLAPASPARAGDVMIREVVTAGPITDAKRAAVVAAARAFYQFWNTGDEAVLKKVIAPTFVDRTLPPGRPQGPTGPAFASGHFRAAVPDLSVTVEKMIVADPFVTVHMRFEGHFTGHFGKTRGKGQAIAFIATDLLEVRDGRVTDNWHIEDNLTLLQQMGVVPPG